MNSKDSILSLESKSEETTCLSGNSLNSRKYCRDWVIICRVISFSLSVLFSAQGSAGPTLEPSVIIRVNGSALFSLN